jgi:acetyl-CoA C-acetyltransferase
MSMFPLIFSKEMTELFVEVMKAKSVSTKIKLLTHFRPQFLAPVIAIEQGLTDPFCGLNMGMTAEVLAREFDISREEQDEFANLSHHRAVESIKNGKFKDEIVPLIFGHKMDKLLFNDIGPRENSTVEGLGKMKPFFDKKSGTVTIGNSCPITDGGSAILMVSENALKKYNLEPMARIKDYHFHGLEPQRMGMGPLLATNGLLEITSMKVEDIDLFEINEAFAAQVLAVKKAFKDRKYSQRFGIDKTLGEIANEKLNVNGGAIALGHPVGSTGSRLRISKTKAILGMRIE